MFVLTVRRLPLKVSAVAGVQRTGLTLSALQMPPCDFQPKKHEGMGKEQAVKVRRSLLSPALSPVYQNPAYIRQGHMQWLFDTDGKRYLDMFAGVATVSVGHCHPKVVKAAKDQLDTLWHTGHIYMHPGIHEYAEQLTSLLPGDLKVVYFTNSGSEANDLALLMARLHTGRYDIISLRNGYHGGSPGYSMGITSLNPWIYEVPGRYGFHQTMNPDVYRGVWGGSKCRVSLSQVEDRQCDCPEGKCSASDKYIEQMNDLLQFSLPKRIAGFIAEYTQGVGGVVQMPRGFLSQAYELVRQRGGVCIADEVQTGFVRTGDHFWGFQSAGVMPDIVTMAKGIGNGFPMAAVVTTPEIAKSMSTALHANTFGGNPLACAVGMAVLDVIEEESIQERVKQTGSYMIQQLMKLREDFDIIGDVRGQGLMLGIELVADRVSRRPFPVAQANKVWEDCKEMGVLIGKGGIFGSVFRIKPPMCITKDDVDFAVDVLRRALDMHQEESKP